MDQKSIIQVEGVSYQYDDGHNALNKISFEIHQGECVACVGANGSGKTTMFLCLNGILNPQKGRILYSGREVKYSKKELLDLRKKVGIVFQEPDHQLFSSSVLEEISFGVLNLGLEKELARKKVYEIIRELHMEHFSEKPTHFLSGGQKKQVAIADVLVMEPEVVLLDEPAAALDPFHTRLIYDYIEELKHKNVTTLISTHDMNHAYAWADRVLVFEKGAIIADGTPTQIFGNKKLLERAHLEQPFILQVYHALEKQKQKKKEENKSYPFEGENGKESIPPRNMKELELWLRHERTGEKKT